MAGSSSNGSFEVTFRRWHGVASWSWNTDDVCAVCHNSCDDTNNETKFPGDDSAVVWGKCNHAFHIACIQKCIEKLQGNNGQGRCPVCRQDWDYKIDPVVPRNNTD